MKKSNKSYGVLFCSLDCSHRIMVYYTWKVEKYFRSHVTVIRGLSMTNMWFEDYNLLPRCFSARRRREAPHFCQRQWRQRCASQAGIRKIYTEVSYYPSKLGIFVWCGKKGYAFKKNEGNILISSRRTLESPRKGYLDKSIHSLEKESLAHKSISLICGV